MDRYKQRVPDDTNHLKCETHASGVTRVVSLPYLEVVVAFRSNYGGVRHCPTRSASDGYSRKSKAMRIEHGFYVLTITWCL